MSTEDDTVMPQSYTDEIRRLIDEAKLEIYNRLAFAQADHVARYHEKPCNREWTSEFLPEDTD